MPNFALEEDSFYQWTDQYDQWDNTSYTLVKEDDMGGSHTFNINNHVSTSQTSNEMDHR